jgi:hypothetical protein
MRTSTPTLAATVAALVSTAACIAQSSGSQPPLEEAAPALRYGQAGSLALDLSAAWATDLDDGNYWMPLSIGVSWFAADGFSLDLAAELYTIDASTPDVSPRQTYSATGGGGSIGVTWHFLEGRLGDRDWSIFADAGIGLLWTGDDVPPGGTRLNFTPRAGVGGTLGLDDRTRLVLGLRWFHVSNAQTGSDNPGIDALQVVAGLSFAF